MKTWTPKDYPGRPMERWLAHRQRVITLLWTIILLIVMGFLFWIQGFP
jgi:hypothetical protein